MFLSPAALAAGVTIEAATANGAPVARLRIDLWQLRPEDQGLAAGDEPAHEPLWKRAFAAADGRHQLPPLPMGDFLLRAQPIDETGWALPLLPESRRFAYGGNEQLTLTAAFRAGLVLRLEAEADGRPPRLCQIEVRDQDGPRPVRWHQRSDERNVTAMDAALLPGRAESAVALPAGPYALEVRFGDAVLPLSPMAAEPGWLRFAVGSVR